MSENNQLLSPAETSVKVTETAQATEPVTELVGDQLPERQNSTGALILAIGKLLLAAVLMLCLINGLTRTFVIVPVFGNSMMPTYHHQQVTLMYSYKSPEKYNYGDVVVCTVTSVDESGEEFHSQIIKRVVGLPGDTLSYDTEKHALVRNGEIVSEPYIADDAKAAGFEWPVGEYTVPENHIFVLGDNRNNSSDSRKYGAVAYEDICGYIIGT